MYIFITGGPIFISMSVYGGWVGKRRQQLVIGWATTTRRATTTTRRAVATTCYRRLPTLPRLCVLYNIILHVWWLRHKSSVNA